MFKAYGEALIEHFGADRAENLMVVASNQISPRITVLLPQAYNKAETIFSTSFSRRPSWESVEDDSWLDLFIDRDFGRHWWSGLRNWFNYRRSFPHRSPGANA